MPPIVRVKSAKGNFPSVEILRDRVGARLDVEDDLGRELDARRRGLVWGFFRTALRRDTHSRQRLSGNETERCFLETQRYAGSGAFVVEEVEEEDVGRQRAHEELAGEVA